MRQRKLTLLLFCLMLITIVQAQVSKTINVQTPGTLSTLLTTTELNTITDLTITGNIDARDFKTMRDLIRNLADLDLTNTTIVAYTGTLGTDGSTTGVYMENAIPQHAFHDASTYNGNVTLKNVTLPNSITTISNNAFASCRGLVSVKTTDAVNSIGAFAFYNCRALENFKIPSTITSIENQVFCDTGLRNVIIPNSVTTIGNQSFWSCDSLIMVSLPNSLNYIASMAFGSCGKLDSVYVYNSTPLNLSYSPFDIEDIAQCTLFVPYKAKSIYAKDKIWNKFSNIVEDNSGFFLSSNSATILSESGAQTTISIFSNTDWSVSVDQSWLNVSPISGNNDNILNLTAEANILFPTRTATITISAKNKASQTITVTQDGFLKTLDNTAGNLISNLSNTEKSTVTRLKITGTMDVRDFKFLRDSMSNLLSLDLIDVSILAYTGSNGTVNYYSSYDANSVPREAFYNSTTGKAIPNLKTLLLPANLKTIGQSAFFYNKSLQNILLPNTLTSIEHYAFSNCENLNNVILPESLIKIGVEAFLGCKSIHEILIPNSVTSIGERMFSNCSSLSHVIYPKDLKSISRSCFEYCSALDNFTIPNSVEFIDMSAFAYCNGLTSLTIPNSVTYINHRAFEHCDRLKSVTIPNSVTYLGSYAFYFCDSIESITIPNSVASTGNSVFEMCRNLKSIYNYSTTPLTIYSYSPIFGFVSKDNCILYVPEGTKSAYQDAFEWKDFVNIIEFTTGLQSTSNSDIEIMTNNCKLIIKNAVVGNKIIIYSISGQKIKEQFIENYQTEISFQKGIYVIRIGNYSDKVVIK